MLIVILLANELTDQILGSINESNEFFIQSGIACLLMCWNC
jgi:hypothetical protein